MASVTLDAVRKIYPGEVEAVRSVHRRTNNGNRPVGRDENLAALLAILGMRTGALEDAAEST